MSNGLRARRHLGSNQGSHARLRLVYIACHRPLPACSPAACLLLVDRSTFRGPLPLQLWSVTRLNERTALCRFRMPSGMALRTRPGEVRWQLQVIWCGVVGGQGPGRVRLDCILPA